MTPTRTTSPDRCWAELPQALLWITVLAAVAKFKKWFFENHAGLCSSKRSRASTSFARGSVRVHDDSGTACESCFKREHRVNVAFQLPPGTIATSIGRHTVRRSASERRSRVDRARQ
jgi:hypothetical protein